MTTGFKRIPLTQGKFALVDLSDFEELSKYKWSYLSGGYAVRGVHIGPDPNHKGKYLQKYIYMHRLILNPPKGKLVDHINRNRLDNRRSNLRLCDYHGNSQNTVISGRSKSGFKGVYLNRTNKKWFAKISHNKKQIHLGLFEDTLSAARAYNKKAKELFGQFAVLNEVDI